MLETLTKHADAPARAMIALIFVLSGFSKIGGYAATQGYMEAFGVPGLLLAPTIVFEIGTGLALLVGYKTRYAALLLAGFTLLSAVIFHRHLGDQVQLVMFLKNIAIAGGLLLVARTGAPGLSVDGHFRAKRIQAT